MEDDVKGCIVKRQTLCHIRLDNADRIPFPLGNRAVRAKLTVGIIKKRTICPKLCKHRHLLSAARCQTKQLFPG